MKTCEPVKTCEKPENITGTKPVKNPPIYRGFTGTGFSAQVESFFLKGNHFRNVLRSLILIREIA
jgi:hypothetical protein